MVENYLYFNSRGTSVPITKGEFDMNKCVICNGEIEAQKTPEGKVFWDKGHNARPVAEGQCCTSCNHSVVIPARLGRSINAH